MTSGRNPACYYDSVLYYKEVRMSEWIECNLPYNTYSKDTPSFAKEVGGENMVGMVVETKDGVYLIGDINPLRGVCDDCTAFEQNTIVLRYRRGYDPGTSVGQSEKLSG